MNKNKLIGAIVVIAITIAGSFGAIKSDEVKAAICSSESAK